MRKFLTSLAAISLTGSLFIGMPTPVAADAATSWKVNPATGESSITHYDTSRNTLGKTQTYVAPKGSVLEMSLYLEAATAAEDLADTVTLTLTNAQFTDTTAVNYGDSESPTDATDCIIDWDAALIGNAAGGVLSAAVGCDTDATGDDYRTTVGFEITLASAGTSAVLEISGAGTSGKVYFFGTDDNDEIVVSSGTLGTANPPVSGTCLDPDFSTNGGAQGSINEALFAAFAAVDGDDDTIIICDGTYTYTADFEEYEGLDLYDGEINLVADNVGEAVLDGNEASRMIYADDVDLTVDGIVFHDGETLSSGGAIRLSDGYLSLSNSEFDGNLSGLDGGAVAVLEGNLDVSDSEFTTNSSGDDGGAVAVLEGNLDVSDSEFTTNNADEHGGALYVYEGSIEVNGSNFDDNASGFKGGAIANKTPADEDFWSMSIEDSLFENNSADYKGGAIFSDHDTGLIVDSSTFADNATNDDDGGAIYSRDDATIGFSVFLRNQAEDDDGGAIYFDERAEIHDSRFVDNFAAEEGGAVFGETRTYVDDTVFLRNRSLDWAGALSLAGNAWLDGAIFRANKSRRGGAIDSWGDRLYLIESRFFNNRATRDGGAIIRDGETLFGDVGPDTIFRGNQARLGDSVAIYRWKVVDGGPGRATARTWSRVWVSAGTTVWLVR